METINSVHELNKLKAKECFYLIKDGQINSYWFAGIHPMTPDLAVAIKGSNYRDSVVFSKLSFSGDSVFLKGVYNSKVVGNIMVAQLQAKISSISKIYLPEKEVQ